MPHIDHIDAEGRRWPSVTELTRLLPQPWVMAWYKHSVQKEGYQGWLNNLAKSEEGKIMGTRVHSEIEDLIKNPQAEACNEAQALYSEVGKTVDEWHEVEPHLICNEHKFQGTADMVVKLSYSPGLWIGDWKTSFTKSDTHPIQLAAYAMAWNEANEMKIDQGFIARVDKKSDECRVKIDEYQGLKRYFPIIIALRQVWDYCEHEGMFFKPKKEKKNAPVE